MSNQNNFKLFTHKNPFSFQVNQLFYLNETLDTSAAHGNGLITKIISEDFDKELMNFCTRIAGFSSQVRFRFYSPMLECFVLDALRLVHETAEEKFWLNLLLHLWLFGEVSTVVHVVTRASLKDETKIKSRETAELIRIAPFDFWKFYLKFFVSQFKVFNYPNIESCQRPRITSRRLKQLCQPLSDTSSKSGLHTRNCTEDSPTHFSPDRCDKSSWL